LADPGRWIAGLAEVLLLRPVAHHPDVTLAAFVVRSLALPIAGAGIGRHRVLSLARSPAWALWIFAGHFNLLAQPPPLWRTGQFAHRASGAEMWLVMWQRDGARSFEHLSSASASLLTSGGRTGRTDRVAPVQIVAEEGAILTHVPDTRAKRDPEDLVLRHPIKLSHRLAS
jgi:hypothetical protein